VQISANCGLSTGSTYSFEVVILHVWEVTSGMKRKQAKSKKQSDKTAWERNVTKLRSRQHALDAQQPVKPVKTD
jgi:hypothetical protein